MSCTSYERKGLFMTEQSKPRKRGHPPHEPTKALRDTVRLHAIVGTRHEMIAQVLQIDVKTLYKYYRRELDTARDLANAQVGGALFNKALAGDTTAQIFWMKTRARWKEELAIDLKSSDGSMSPAKPTRAEILEAQKAIGGELDGLD